MCWKLGYGLQVLGTMVLGVLHLLYEGIYVAWAP